MRVFCLLFAIGLGTSLSSPGQTENHPLETAAQFTTLNVNTLGERALGFGVRSSYEFTRRRLIIDPEVEFNSSTTSHRIPAAILGSLKCWPVSGWD